MAARAIEAAGIPTVCVSLARELTQAVGAPRSLFLKWPLGHPLGEPHNTRQQETVIFDALHLLCTATTPGVIMEPGYRWRRQEYQAPAWERVAG